MVLEFWYLFPVAVGIATVAMASGVEGATFFAPIFLLVLGLPPETAVGAGLVTEVFGFASGLTAYVRRGLIDYALARMLLVVTVPAAIGGSLVVHYIRPDILEAILGMGLIAVAISFLTAPDHDEIERLDQGVADDVPDAEQESGRRVSVVTTRDGNTTHDVEVFLSSDRQFDAGMYRSGAVRAEIVTVVVD